MSRLSMSLAVLALATGLFAACEYGDEGPPNPAPSGAAPVDPGTGGNAGSAGGPPIHPVIRTVEMRNPLGDILGNLLIDGDFEFAAQREGSSGQVGWYVFGNGGQQHLRTETGGLCRSGLRCAVLAPNVLMYGRGTAANGSGMLASLLAKLPAGSECAVLDATISRCSFAGFGVKLQPQSSLPNEDGWCRYRGSILESQSSMCMVIESTMTGTQTALIDAATLLPDDGTAPQQVMQALPVDQAERFRKVSRRVRDLLPIGGPPSQPAELGER